MKTFADCLDERRDLLIGENYGPPIERAVEEIVRAIRSGGRVLLFGNGGSAAQAQHIAAEFSGRFLAERPAWSGIALTTDTSALTAIANDYGFERVFERQVRAIGRRGDVAIGFTTSGSSKNVIEGLRAAKEIGAVRIVFTGNGGGPVVDDAEIAIVGPTGPSWKVQEVHLALGHIMCELCEIALLST
ncbi:MAG TPA: SIS domain-containing protein [Candidatus Eremiobacteraceae bacterium]|nr:SIS domain-containing protein [Candidatus Eremiobacteraceae bacterium]